MQDAPTDSAFDVPPLQAIRARRQRAGECAVSGTTLQIVGESLRQALDIQPGERVLDAACVEGRLPYPDGTFDAVVSTFAIMSAPDRELAAAELLRMCRPGGRIGLACWTPEGFVGRLLGIVGRHVALPPGIPDVRRWGAQAELRRMFGGASVDGALRHFAFRYRSATHWIDVFRGVDGPVLTALDTLDTAERVALNADIMALVGRFDMSGSQSVVVPAEYFEAVIVRR